MMNCELAHYGVKGMKWGVRRYQNPDGSLKPAGKKRYSEGGGMKSPAKTSTSKSSSTTSRKKVSEMTDEELNRAVRRLQLEQQYRQLNPEKVSAGQKFVNKVTKDVLVPAATDVARNAVRQVLEKEAKRFLGISVKDDKQKDK